MKKFYLLLVALIVATIPALAADWYLVGSGMTKDGQDSKWDNFKPFALETVSEGVYKIDGVIFNQDCQFKIKQDGTWEYSVSSNGTHYATLGASYAYNNPKQYASS